MNTIQEKLETLFDKVRALSEERQQAAAEALSEITSESYMLSEDELRALRPALERAQRGEYADEADVSELLNKPWHLSCGLIPKRLPTLGTSERIFLPKPTRELRGRSHLRLRMEKLRHNPRLGIRTSEPDIRVLSPTRYLYRIYYTITADAVVILHVRHSARRDPDFSNLAD
ncbi:MAG: hypothetical protein WCC41_01540 [Rhodomicrobium sp.]